MKKILLATLEYPPQKGGVASYYFGIVEELKKRGHEINVVDKKLLSKIIWPHWVQGYFTLRKMIKNTKPDFVFVGQILPIGTIAYLLRKKVPYIVFIHGMDILSARKHWRKKRLMKKIIQKAIFIVPNSNYTKGLVERFANTTDPIYPCPNINTQVDENKVQEVRNRLSLTGKNVLLTVGRIVERKGHAVVINALPEIIKHFPNVVYVIAGEGEELGKLNKLVIDLNLQNSVRLVGSITDDEKPLYYSLCHIFVMPSKQINEDVEGFGLVFLEAALFAKPSIGGNSGGVPEAILHGKTGLIVEPDNFVGLAADVVQLLRDSNLASELGKNAKARAIYEFTWEKQVQKLNVL